MAVRVPYESLPEDARRALERGEPIEFERDGEVVARFDAERSWEERLESYERDLAERGGADYDEFLEDLEDIRREGNRPVEIADWES